MSEAPTKKQKLGDEDGRNACPIPKEFNFKQILTDNGRSKMVCFHGTIPARAVCSSDTHTDSVIESGQGDGEGQDVDSVVILEKTPFSKDNIERLLSSQPKSELLLQNDIYGTHLLFPDPTLNALKATVICPATEKHIAKYTSQNMYMLQESSSCYQDITPPQMEKRAFNIQWVFNILEKKSESERIVFEDADPETGFILLPDMKWDGKQKEDLYLVAIVHKHGIKSLRDLRSSHIHLLQNILKQGTSSIAEKFGVSQKELRIYLHYQPSYYHLHVHFTHLKFEAPGSSVERAHLLTDVIDNLLIDGDYYKKKTLYFPCKSKDGLYTEFVEKGCV